MTFSFNEMLVELLKNTERSQERNEQVSNYRNFTTPLMLIGKGNIGIAEDHKRFRDALKTFLEANKYIVLIEAENGNDLILKIQEASEKPAICIVNANMPVLGGCETVVLLKQSNPEIKIIALSDDRLKGKKMVTLGADIYLEKYNCDESLIKCISKLVEKCAIESGKD